MHPDSLYQVLITVDCQEQTGHASTGHRDLTMDNIQMHTYMECRVSLDSLHLLHPPNTMAHYGQMRFFLIYRMFISFV